MRALALFAPLALGSCISVSWQRDARFEPPPRGALETLHTGESELGAALGVLGAPLYVWELPEGGVALGYGWFESQSKGVRVSVPFARRGSASLRYDNIDADMRGCVLLFDAHEKLALVRRGRLLAISSDLRVRRPADPEDS